MMADKQTVLRLLKTARGQLDGIIKMVEDDRYCMDISQQVLAADAMLRRVNKEILSAHLKHCVEHAEQVIPVTVNFCFMIKPPDFR